MTAKHAKEMTDTEYDAARRSHAWRGEPQPRPPAPSAEQNAAARERVATMTDTEFDEAKRNKEWRK